MLGALFKGSKSKDESEEPPERAFVVVRGFQAEEIRDTSDAGSIPVQREGRLVHVDIPLFPPEHYAGPASPRFHSSLQSTLSPSESHPPHPSTHSQDIFSYIRNSPDPHLTLNMPIADLCKHIRVASMTPTPPNSPTTPQSPSPADNLITWASWFKETVGLRHEFLTLKVKGFNGERDFWMRFDRSAAGVRKSWGLGLMGNSHFNIKSVSSIYQANDVVSLI
ncbi:uncharacterized protein EI90DRAFT_264688 [Cantharellus anzutake]|uniref:uncharacterized protein n=1 Tax=Cantharellus anzutake TaxID=1750568 RepID=UPI00190792B7|nr:uncharacterized protein EI90DRAFT_264688 [Cantharellus anzutake]KAF8335842.1 hypothetical protein EI90DRAFT_264688 [Cantharellus anzutake]